MNSVFKSGALLFLFNSSQYMQAAFVSYQFRGKPQAEIPGEVQYFQFFQAVGKYKQLKGWDTIELPWQTTVHPMQTSMWYIHGITTTDTLKKPWLATGVVHQSSLITIGTAFLVASICCCSWPNIDVFSLFLDKKIGFFVYWRDMISCLHLFLEESHHVSSCNCNC